MNSYTVRQVAKMAGVSVRTLHHYDHIGLLKPAARTVAGYRLYQEAELLRLQQILFFKELDLSLNEIRRILDDTAFDPVAALAGHRRVLKQRVQRLLRLLQTVDNTILKLTEEDNRMTLTDADLYEGFSTEQIEAYRQEVNERYDPERVTESYRRIGKMSKLEWKNLKEEGAAISREIAAGMEQPPDSPVVQQLIARHHAMIEKFYPAPAEVYRELGRLYIEDSRFKAYYDEFRPGLAEFMQKAMNCFADHAV